MGIRTIADETLAALVRGAPDAVVAVDQDGCICVFNAAAEAAFNVRADEAVGHTVDSIPALAPLKPLIDAARSEGPLLSESLDLPGGRKAVQVFVAEDYGALIPEPLYDLVHDLKTPIAATKGFIDLIEGFGPLNDRQLTYARRAHISLLSMLGLVHELLDMAWMEAGGVLHVKTVSLNELVQRALKDYAVYAGHQGVELVVDLPDDCVFEADSPRLESVISNLASNAIKYSPNGGTVSIRARCSDNRLTVRVEDQGIGIAAEHLPRIFDRFYRVNAPATERIKGSGLGLAIVKTVIEKHGGELFVESTHGVDSVFGFSLPLVAASPAAVAERQLSSE